MEMSHSQTCDPDNSKIVLLLLHRESEFANPPSGLRDFKINITGSRLKLLTKKVWEN